MKYLLLLTSLLLFSAGVFAQVNTDSVTYNKQRNKINAMLAARKVKFSQYDSSLTKRSGIFRMQTKNDIRRSNDILMDIVSTDDEIFIELKKLFDYRTSQLNYTAYQKKQIENNAKEIEKARIGYMNTINSYRKQNEALSAQLKKQIEDYEKKKVLSIIVFGFMLASILVLLVINRKRKA
ncbi:hypothetical protein [Mucilaginibacter aquariorum]|uniref:Chemotaxis methyl-accepting receptor HlyB-like 4HB MCP domain-containing protein n=1 Tax=Mucilaginibacter aquariorum TaxID=2967225 RepID=A0ABT1SWT6_9SPHI|nr:hypothetical protein [Mucilaginibacter aquariorum]MCQ6956814.1 hypothetical protein [Mucilaginibacter aquariorum]